MKKWIALLLWPLLAASAPRSVSVDEQSILLSPTDFFVANSNRLNPAISRLNPLANLNTATARIDIGTNVNGLYFLRAATFANAATAHTPPAAGFMSLIASNNTMWLLKSDGTFIDLAVGGGLTNVPWGRALYVDSVNGNDSSAQGGNAAKPFLTPTAAKNAAVAGDTIIFRMGSYTVTNLLKGGVHYRADGPVELIWPPDPAGGLGIFDDRGSGKTTNTIRGPFKLTYIDGDGEALANGLGLVVVTNGSQLSFEFGHAEIYDNAGSTTYSNAVFHIKNGSVYIKGDEIFDVGETADSHILALFVEKGDVVYDVKRTMCDHGRAVWLVQPAGAGSRLTLTADVLMTKTGDEAVRIDASSETATNLLSVKVMRGSSTGPLTITGGQNSVVVDSLESDAQAYPMSLSGGKNSIVAKTIIGQGSFFSLSGGWNDVRLQRGWSAVAGSATVPAIAISGGTNVVDGGLMQVTNAIGMKLTGQHSTRLKNLTIQTFNSTGSGNTNSPIDNYTNGLVLQNVTLIAPNSSVDSIRTTNTDNHTTIEGTLQLSTPPRVGTVLTNGLVMVRDQLHNQLNVRGVPNTSGGVSLYSSNQLLTVTLRAGDVLASNIVVRPPTNGPTTTATNLTGVYLGNGDIQLIWAGDNASGGGTDNTKVATNNGVAYNLELRGSLAYEWKDISGTDIDWAAGNSRSKTLAGNTTFTFSNPNNNLAVAVLIRQDGTGGRTVTWPSTIYWINSTNKDNSIAVDTAANHVTYFYFWRENGTNFGTATAQLDMFDADFSGTGAGVTSTRFFARITDENGSGAVAGSLNANMTNLSFTATTIDATTAGVTFKAKNYLWLKGFDLVSGVTVPNTNDITQNTFMKPVFSNSADESANYIEWHLNVPDDIDTSVDPRAKIKFKLNGADTGTHRYVLSMANVADSAAYAGTVGTAINLDFAGDASGANNDVETVGFTTLTGWGAAVTAGRHWVIRLARDGNATQDGSTVDSMLSVLVIEYGITQ